MRFAVLVFLAGCTYGNQPVNPTAPPPADPDRMPSVVLDKQDPSADTSKNKVLSRSVAHYEEPRDYSKYGCQLPPCSTGDGGGLVVIAALAFVLRRRRQLTDRKHRRKTPRATLPM